MKKFDILQKNIIEISNASEWWIARKEWKLSYLYDSEESMTCLCSHYPIREICVITNKETGHAAEIGNHCIKQFLGLETGKIFDSVKKINKKIDSSVNEETLDYALENNIISNWEHGFYLDIRLKRNLSEKQNQVKMRINNKISCMLAKSSLYRQT